MSHVALSKLKRDKSNKQSEPKTDNHDWSRMEPNTRTDYCLATWYFRSCYIYVFLTRVCVILNLFFYNTNVMFCKKSWKKTSQFDNSIEQDTALCTESQYVKHWSDHNKMMMQTKLSMWTMTNNSFTIDIEIRSGIWILKCNIWLKVFSTIT